MRSALIVLICWIAWGSEAGTVALLACWKFSDLIDDVKRRGK